MPERDCRSRAGESSQGGEEEKETECSETSGKIRNSSSPHSLPVFLRASSADTRITLADLDLPEPPSLEGRFEELIDPFHHFGRPWVRRRDERRLHLTQRLELAEELNVAEVRRARQ